jgi:small subunit ribosomal protein S17
VSRAITGRVSSDKADKTIVVRVVMSMTHPIYKKQYTRHRKYLAHDEKNEARTGDLVVIIETKPKSRRKKFTLDKIIERAQVGFEEKDADADLPKEQLDVAEANDQAISGTKKLAVKGVKK